MDAEGDADAGGDNIAVSWSADSDGDSQFRVVVEMAVASLGGSTVSLVAGGGTFDPTGQGEARSWSLPVIEDFTANWTVVGGAQIGVTAADLNAAISVRVDARQEGVDEDDGDVWPEERQGTAVSVAAKPADDNGG